jgi:hypothetical protein
VDGLKDRLESLASQATAGIDPPPLDKRRRQHRLRRVGVTAALVVACIAASVYFLAAQNSPRGLLVHTAGNSQSSITGLAPAGPDTSTDLPAGTLEKVAAVVRSIVIQDSLAARPATAQVVQTTIASAERALGYSSRDNGSAPAFVAVTQGMFECETNCLTGPGPTGPGTYLTVVVDWTGPLTTKILANNEPFDLAALGRSQLLDISSAPLPTEPGPACTKTDLSAPADTTMPQPTTLTAPLTIEPGIDLIQLSPPKVTPAVTAQQAWNKMEPPPNTLSVQNGPVQLILGYLYSATPAQIQNYVWPPTASNPDTASKPIYTHTLVWALFAQHQAVSAGGGSGPRLGPGPVLPSTANTIPTATSPTTVATPVCTFETIYSFVDATTGQLILDGDLTPGQ